MDVFEAIEKRRSVKHFDSSQEINDAELKKILEATILSPTSFNMQNWRFVVIKDKEIRKQIQEVSWNQAQVTESSVVIVLTADLNAWGKSPERYWKNAPEEAQKVLVPMIPKFYENQPELQRDEAMRSCGIAGQTIMLAAKGLGYDTNPMIGFDPKKLAQIINLPDDHVIGFMIVIGKPLKPAMPRGGQLPLDEVVIYDKFS